MIKLNALNLKRGWDGVKDSEDMEYSLFPHLWSCIRNGSDLDTAG